MNKEDPDRKRSREEFNEIMLFVRGQDIAMRSAVGHAVNVANGLFYERFESLEKFMNHDRAEQMKYLGALRKFQESLPENDVVTYLGFNLFGKWIAAIVANDNELMLLFTEGLSIITEDAPDV